MMEIRLKLTFLENLFLCLCLLTGLEQANGSAVVRVREGSEADLPCFIRPEKNIERDHFEWRKVGQMVFLYKNGNHSNNGLPGQDEQFKGRVSHFPERLQFSDASIRIRDTKESDRGTYTCDFSPDDFNRQIFNIDLAVCSIIRDRSEENIGGVSPQPRITSLEQTRYEAKLQCEVRRVSPKPKVKWQDSSGNILPAKEPQVTERGGNYDIILKTTVTKTDDYRCVVTQEEICHQISAETSVFIPGFPTGPVVGVAVPAVLLLIVVGVLPVILYKCYKRGAALRLSVTTFKTDDGMLLVCVVQGASPKPKVEWQDSSGNILPAEEPQVTEKGGKYDIILRTTVTKTDKYRCVVTQEGINHQVSEEISVKIPVSELFVRTFETKDGMLLQCEVRGASPKPKVELKDSSGNILPPEELQVIERGGKYFIILNTTVTENGKYQCVVKQEGINHQVSEEISVKIPVFTDPEPPEGKVSELSVRTFKTKDGMLLQCEVRGVSPKPEVKWQDSSGKILPAEEPQVKKRRGKYDIILQTTVTKTGNYRCVATQEGIKDQIEIYVFIPGEASKLSVMKFKTKDGMLLQCDVQGASPKPKVEWQDSSGNILPAEEPQVTERGGKYDIILNTTVTKTGNYRCVIKQEGIEDQTKAEIFVFIPGAWGGFKRWFCWWCCSFCKCCKKDSQTERKGDEEELDELNRNHDTSAV